MSVEIQCPACGGDALLIRTPQYEGFARIGEALTCSACGHTFADESEVVFKEAEKLQVFTDADRPEEMRVFDEERPRICAHCINYIINPFTQWCSVHQKEVEATDTCDRFEEKPEEEEDSSV